MEEPDSHAGLESRLKVLATHIAELRQMMNQAKGARRNEDFDEIEKLERRYKALDDKLCRLDLEGPDLWQGAKAEMEAETNELTRWVEEHLTWIESGYQSDRRPKAPKS
jgi:hypothetical protein